LVVARTGDITQLVPFHTIAWHAGRSQFGNRVGFNRYSIGIEIDNAGVLEKRGNKYYSWFNKAYEADEVVFAVHRNEKTPRYWHAFTQEQIACVEEICRALVQTYRLKYILGHEEISPGRKIDPGPAFPLDKLRERIFGGSRDSDEPERARTEGVVTTDLLNIREDASTNSDKVAKPLVKGQRVRIVGAKDGWYKVTTEVTGWVSAKYIE
jgi:N-acetylmuramoyl-L-alanine amidase